MVENAPLLLLRINQLVRPVAGLVFLGFSLGRPSPRPEYLVSFLSVGLSASPPPETAGKAAGKTLSGLLARAGLLPSTSTRRRSEVVELFRTDLTGERALPRSLDSEVCCLQLLDWCIRHPLQATFFAMRRLGVPRKQAHDKSISFGTRIRVRIVAEEIVIEAGYEWAVAGWPSRCLAGVHRRDDTVTTVDCA
jgi:hypothetical protein